MSVASGLKQEFKRFKTRKSGSAFHFNVVDNLFLIWAWKIFFLYLKKIVIE